ncbi:MAG: STAS domain-containing protein [Treponema sp.]|nr:STAS domain-containing protein [Treponema sp.]MBP5751662.1 STAS domain-containing protein [Treponema sp.]
MDQLTIHEKSGANYMLFELAGSVNGYTLAEFQEKVYSYIQDTNVVLDMSEVLSIDAAGVGVVLAGINDGEEHNTQIFIMNPSESARHALERTGFLDTFNIIHGITEVSDVS